MTDAQVGKVVSYGEQLARWAAERPADVAITYVDGLGGSTDHTYAELEAAAQSVAGMLRDRGVRQGDLVGVALSAGLTHAAASLGAWKLGAGVVVLNPRLPAWELQRIVEVAAPRVLIGEFDVPEAVDIVGREACRAVVDAGPSQLIDAVLPPRGIVFTSGGSTGVPKLINSFGPGGAVPGRAQGQMMDLLRLGGCSRILVTSPMYHGLGFANVFFNVHNGSRVICLTRFTPEAFWVAFDRLRADYAIVVPTMMQRLVRSPGFETADLSSLTTLFHAASVCPEWAKRAWLDRLGPERVLEYYGASEQHGSTVIDGVEWLAHPGSIGRPELCDVKVLDDAGDEVPRGTVGELFMKARGVDGPVYEYINRERGPVTADGFASVGDLGWQDDDGYLYIADRRTDMVISGGANVFPAEVEGVISELPGVADVAVIGLADPEWGRRVHAIIERQVGGDVDADIVLAWCRDRLLAYKVPKSIEFIEVLPRNEAGKIRRSEMVADRERAAGTDPLPAA
ncbi:MAG: AMP-binding protein [Ilumatobacteraceae bacterium]